MITLIGQHIAFYMGRFPSLREKGINEFPTYGAVRADFHSFFRADLHRFARRAQLNSLYTAHLLRAFSYIASDGFCGVRK